MGLLGDRNPLNFTQNLCCRCFIAFTRFYRRSGKHSVEDIFFFYLLGAGVQIVCNHVSSLRIEKCRLPRIKDMTGIQQFSKYLKGKKRKNTFRLICLLGNGCGIGKNRREGWL